MSVSVFLSYSHENRRIARSLKAGLEQFGMEAFLAHEDLSPSSNWLRVIRKNLRGCQVFMPLLTKEFKKSDWTDQETGFAVALRKVILPITVDFLPYGFIHEIHAQEMPKHMNAIVGWRVVKHLAKHTSLRDNIIDGLVQVCADSNSFIEAASNFEYLIELAPFSMHQMKSIFEAAIKNRQIYDSFGAQSVLERLMREQSAAIPKRLAEKYRRKLSG